MLKDVKMENLLLLVIAGLMIHWFLQPSSIKNKGVLTDEETENSVQPLNQPEVSQECEEECEEVVVPMSASEEGASLKTAFQKPVANQEKTQTVNFNKQPAKLDSSNYLPKQVNSEWWSTDFVGAKYNVKGKKLINVNKYVVGINTVGQSLKNASWDIRGTIPNPKYTVSPWNNSTYEPDYNIKPLC